MNLLDRIRIQQSKIDFGKQTVDTKVNVMTGKRGWHKRINNNKTQVKRTAEFSDGTSIDKDGAGLDKMESAIKKATLKSIKSTITAPNPSAMRCGSEPAGGVPCLFLSLDS